MAKVKFYDGSGVYEINEDRGDYWTYTRKDGNRGKAFKVNDGVSFDYIGDSPKDVVSASVENTVSVSSVIEGMQDIELYGIDLE
jgi:hypothetical protein